MIRSMILFILLFGWMAMSALDGGETTPGGPTIQKGTTAETIKTGGDASAATARVSGKAYRTWST